MRDFINSRSPPAILAGFYAIWIAAGALALKLPIATVATPATLSWLDALFTATSAVTVTGLAVVDTGSTFTVFGQVVLLLLVQLGGTGLMTFAVLVLSSLGLKISLSERRFLRQELGMSSMSGLLELAWIIFRAVVACEIIGAALLAFVFVPSAGWSIGLWQALFHSVSAFNNAGFSLFSDSLMSYAQEPLVVFTISTQFIIGGLGFVVLSDLFLLRRWSRFSLHTRLMLVGTVALVVLSVVGYGFLEWNNPSTLGALSSLPEKLQAAWFEGVTPRTAGFNALDTAAMRDSTTLLTMVLMVIGGGTTSTAGGIKVTTFLVLILATLAFFRTSGRMRAFGFSIGPQQGLKVMALLTVSLLLILTALFALLLTQSSNFLDLAFEVSSAFGTVGLSRGATSELDGFGQIVICIVMFLGRLGPLSFGFLLATKQPPRVKYPEGEVFLG